MTVTIGRIVRYTLTEQDANAINKRRADATTNRQTDPLEANGYVAHVGNHAEAGQVFPATVVRVFDPSTTTANLQVTLDGNDTYWATSVAEGEGQGRWSWPPRVG